MDIYPQICFVYKWTQLSTGKWYIGSRTAKGCHTNDGYICSSKIVKPIIQKNPEDWIRIILANGTVKDMLQLEHELLVCLNAAKSIYSYNMTNGACTFSRTGAVNSPTHRAKLSESNKGRTHSNETRSKMSNSAIGKTKSDTHRTNLSISNKGQTRSIESRSKMSESAKIKIFTLEHKTNMSTSMIGKNCKPQTIVTCPSCSKIGGLASMKRWHFDNCRFKNG